MTAPDRFTTEVLWVRIVFGADMMPDRATLLRLVRDQLAGELGAGGLFCRAVIDEGGERPGHPWWLAADRTDERGDR